jgi:tRNA(Ile)-lysidine synthase
MTWSRWRFSSAEAKAPGDPWRAELPAQRLWIRAWRTGDRLRVRRGEAVVERKVKYFLSDAHVSGHIRSRWPVVLAGDEIVWIPGIRRSDAATARSGGPVVTYVCDYLDRRS